nr:protein crossbronx [Quercus suber]
MRMIESADSKHPSASLKHACPKGIYVAPDPERSLQWIGVLFVRKGRFQQSHHQKDLITKSEDVGPYANAVLHFRIMFPTGFPLQPPSVTFLSDVFHPLVNPLTTYTYSTRNPLGETISAADQQRLPPGGLSLRHMFPDWFHGSTERSQPSDSSSEEPPSDGSPGGIGSAVQETGSTSSPNDTPHVVEILQYLRVIFDTEAVLDSVPLEAAANSGAWHAWKSYRSRTLGTRATSPTSRVSNGEPAEASTPSRQQPGGAKRPGEWDWKGVWEDRVRRSIQASISEPVLFGRDGIDVVNFHRMEPEILEHLIPNKVQ